MHAGEKILTRIDTSYKLVYNTYSNAQPNKHACTYTHCSRLHHHWRTKCSKKASITTTNIQGTKTVVPLLYLLKLLPSLHQPHKLKLNHEENYTIASAGTITTNSAIRVRTCVCVCVCVRVCAWCFTCLYAVNINNRRSIRC